MTPKRHSVPQILTIEPGPWRRRKRLVMPVFLANLSDALLLAVFIGITVYSCWFVRNPSQNPPPRARMRTGSEIPGQTRENTP